MLRFKEYLFGSLNYSSADTESVSKTETESANEKKTPILGFLSESINNNLTRLKTFFSKSKNKDFEVPSTNRQEKAESENEELGDSEVPKMNGQEKAKKKNLGELSEKLKDALKNNKWELAAGLAGTIAAATGATAFGLLTKSVIDQNNFIANADKLNLNGAYLAHQKFITEYLNIVNSPNSLHFLQNDPFIDLVTNDKLKDLFTSLTSVETPLIKPFIIELTSNSDFLKLIENKNFTDLLKNEKSLKLLLDNSKLFTENFDSIQKILGNESMIQLMQNQDLVKLLGDNAFREFLLNPDGLSQYYSNGALNGILDSKYTDFLNNNKELLNNPQIQGLLSDSKILDLIKDGKLNELYQNEAIKNLLSNPTFKDLLANPDMLKILGDQEIIKLLNNTEIMNALRDQEFVNMLQANGFSEMISQDGIYKIMNDPNLQGYLDIMNKPPLEGVNKEAIISLVVPTLIFGIATAICLMIANRKGKKEIIEKVNDLEKTLDQEQGKQEKKINDLKSNQKNSIDALEKKIDNIQQEIDSLESKLENKEDKLGLESQNDMGFTNPGNDFNNDHVTKQEDPSPQLNTTHQPNRGSGYKVPETPDSNK